MVPHLRQGVMTGCSGLIYLTFLISKCLYFNHRIAPVSCQASFTMSATQSRTAVQSNMKQNPLFLLLVGSSSLSDNIASQQYPSSRAKVPNPNQNNVRDFRQHSTKTSQQVWPLHESFDLETTHLSSRSKAFTKANQFQTWLARKYYQYEVTWGLYVLTPAEKLIINSLVLFMISLILYGASQIAFFHSAIAFLLEFVSNPGTSSMAYSRHLELHRDVHW